MKDIFVRATLLGLLAISYTACSSGGDGNEGPEKKPAHNYFVYAANSGSNNISAYKIDLAIYWYNSYPTTGTGKLTPLAGSPFAAGTTPCSMVVAESDVLQKTDYLYVTNSSSNDISAYAIDYATGALTPAGTFPAGTEPVSVAFDRRHLITNSLLAFVYVANHGSNNISAYSINDETGALTPLPGSPFDAGSGPSSITVDLDGQFLYVANANSDNISAYAIDSDTGALTQMPGSPFPAGSGPCSAALFSSFFLYAVNANSNNISAFTCLGSAALTPIPASPIEAGIGPSSITCAGQYAYVTNYGSNNISAYAVDSATGALTSIASSPFSAGAGPSSITLDTTREYFAYVTNYGSNTISAYTFNKTTGTLTPMAGSPFAAGTSPRYIISAYTTPSFH